MALENYRYEYNVSIHAPARGATDRKTVFLPPSKFQSTPLREGRPWEGLIAHECSEFQSTPLREGRLVVLDHFTLDGNVSIHAPARGATKQIGPLSIVLLFQSTPLREGRLNL